MCPAEKPTLQELGVIVGARAGLFGSDWIKWCDWLGINTLAVKADSRELYPALLKTVKSSIVNNASLYYFYLWQAACRLEETLTWEQQRKVWTWIMNRAQ